MGTSHGNFTKYPRTPHLFGSKGTDDDKHLGEAESKAFIADESLIAEEKIDGTNVGIHFTDSGKMTLQCRGHLITEGMHPQYDLLKQWAAVKRHVLEQRLESRFILFGEWVYARHSIHYRKLTHHRSTRGYDRWPLRGIWGTKSRPERSFQKRSMLGTKIERHGSTRRRRPKTTPSSHLSEPRSWRPEVAPGERRLALRAKRNPGLKNQDARRRADDSPHRSIQPSRNRQNRRLAARIRWIACRWRF